MNDSRRNRRNLFLPLIGLAVLLVTISLTYLGDTLSAFRGSQLAYLGWLILAIGTVFGFLVLRRPASRRHILLRNTTLTIGLIVICFAVILCKMIEGIMRWW